jgi:prephenate dehydrogenase
MQTILVVGLGEIGGTIYSVLKQNKEFQIFGTDIDKTKMQEHNS